VCDADDGHVLAALAVHAPTARANLNDLLETVPKLKDTAVKIAPLLQTARNSASR
jgi:DNA-binding IclR family transcriptional regulator